MPFLILVMLAVVVQTTVPVPRKAATDTSKASRSTQAGTNGNTAPSAKPQPARNPVKPDAPKLNGSNALVQYKEETTPLRLAPVDVNKDWADYLSILANLLLTLATFLIAIYAAIQARAAQQNARAYEQTVRLTERADVLLDAAGFDTQGATGDSRVQLRFKNFGRTRASNVKFQLVVTIPELGDYPPNPLPPLPIGAGDVQTVVFMRMREWLTKDTFQQVLNGQTSLRFHGAVTYQDVFDVPHTTKCSGTLNWRTLTFGIDATEAD